MSGYLVCGPWAPRSRGRRIINGMLDLAFLLLCAAVLVGLGLAVAYLRGPQAKPPPRALPFVHGTLGGASLAALIAALRQGLPPTGMGTSGFGMIGAGLLGLALAFGLALGLQGRYHRPPGAVVGVHASLAIAGFVVLLTLFALSPGGGRRLQERMKSAVHGLSCDQGRLRMPGYLDEYQRQAGGEKAVDIGARRFRSEHGLVSPGAR